MEFRESDLFDALAICKWFFTGKDWELMSMLQSILCIFLFCFLLFRIWVLLKNFRPKRKLSGPYLFFIIYLIL
jgi:hypothetical protein